MATPDECARRKVADQVRAVVVAGVEGVANAAERGHPMSAIVYGEDMAKAASAVVLASDLRVFGSPNRQGWRARLANVERLLVEAREESWHGDVMYSGEGVKAALAEVRAMIDGDGE